ncbi:rhodanese-like domain-containing protein [Saccharicrinis aurantiacus]|uniref:rhodanese-like domain-containing protein n=1 Tax=Saccharicrinis aurantiacus TaxID=1849719 RepID=UPI0008390BB4|nr:rhodanese-like domain-containing protein [Saccharicrinis aurantiacus]
MNISEATIIDVRTTAEFSMGNATGSINIPLDTLPHRLDEVKNFKLPLVICCASGGRSHAACEYLSKQGFTDLYDGGAWVNVQNALNN